MRALVAMRLQLAELTCEEEVEECFERCKEKYGGTTMTDSYYCSKGCAALSDEDVTKIDKYCNIDDESTYVASAAASWRGEAMRADDLARRCLNGCQTASSNLEHVGECEYGCEYWAWLPEETAASTTKTKATWISKSTWNEVAFIAILGLIMVFMFGYRRRRMRMRSAGSQPYQPIKTVYSQGTEII